MNTTAAKIIRLFWINSFLFSLLVFGLLFNYTFIYFHTLSIHSLSVTLAGTAGILIGTSFSLSGICYYIPRFQHYLGYRKYIGIIGYFFSLLYCFSLLIDIPDIYYFGFFTHFWSVDIVFGLLAMCILTGMFLISNTKAMTILTNARWRFFLRFGYIAYMLLVLRAYFLEHELWITWVNSLSGLPPLRLVLSLFAICVILLRGSLFIAIPLKNNKSSLSATE